MTITETLLIEIKSDTAPNDLAVFYAQALSATRRGQPVDWNRISYALTAKYGDRVPNIRLRAELILSGQIQPCLTMSDAEQRIWGLGAHVSYPRRAAPQRERAYA